MSHDDLSSTEPILSIEGIEPVLAHYSSLFDKVRKNATEQIRVNVSSAVDSLFDVYVDYMKTVTTKAYSVANHEHGGEKYVPLSLVESGARVMQIKLRQLMSTEIDATSLKLYELLKAPLHLPLKVQNSDSDDHEDDQHDSDARTILDQLENNLEDISEDENDNEDQNKRKRNRQKRQTELSCEKIAQMCVLIHKLERYQLLEQTMLLRRLQIQKKEQIDPQPRQQLIQQQTSSLRSTFSSDFDSNNEQSQLPTNESLETNDLEQFEPLEHQLFQSNASASSSLSTSMSYIINDEQPSSNENYLTNQHVPESTQSELTEQQLSQSPSTSFSTSSVVHHCPISPARKPVKLRLAKKGPGIYQLVPQSNGQITTQQNSPIGQLKPANLDCPHCSDRFEARATLNAHILSVHKCCKQSTRLYHCAFVGCSASRSHKSHLWCHIVTFHRQITGDLVEYFDIVDK